MRGTLGDPLLADIGSGIIPAYAGNTCRTPVRCRSTEDHPRVCGEHRGGGLNEVDHDGIIPAYAGNTTYWKLHELYVRDHPRVCGEHHVSHIGLACTQGSSPRMRGTLEYSSTRLATPGIIPAYAGNTIAVMFSRIEVRDHPRVCGEH